MTSANSRFSEKNKNRKNPLRLMQNGSDEPFCIKRKAINRKNNCSAGNITEYSVRRMDNSILFAAVRLVQS